MVRSMDDDFLSRMTTDEPPADYKRIVNAYRRRLKRSELRTQSAMRLVRRLSEVLRRHRRNLRRHITMQHRLEYALWPLDDIEAAALLDAEAPEGEENENTGDEHQRLSGRFRLWGKLMCLLDLHDWEEYGYRKQCKREHCGKRVNIP